ncbi:MAG: methyltransferase domain-containing protein, partial [Defluviitaleaceae bacterium]|nr:methyltransferase domain-containing protein [Defluviitaleaceae bacterium]
MDASAICEHFGSCGGCSYLNISYGDELSIKRDKMAETFSRYSSVYEGIVPAPKATGYRNKMEFAFGDELKGGALALGIRKRGSFYEVATPKKCCLIPDCFAEIVAATLDYFNDAGETFYHRRSQTGALRHLVLRRGENTGDLLVNLSTSQFIKADLPGYAERVAAVLKRHRLAGVLHSVYSGVSDRVSGDDCKIVVGDDFFYEKIRGLVFCVTAYSFFQTNTSAAEVLFETVGRFAGEGDAMLDMYCGAGAIALSLSNQAKSVTGFDISPDAVSAAKKNAALNGIDNCVFFAGDAQDAIGELKM